MYCIYTSTGYLSVKAYTTRSTVRAEEKQKREPQLFTATVLQQWTTSECPIGGVLDSWSTFHLCPIATLTEQRSQRFHMILCPRRFHMLYRFMTNLGIFLKQAIRLLLLGVSKLWQHLTCTSHQEGNLFGVTLSLGLKYVTTKLIQQVRHLFNLQNCPKVLLVRMWQCGQLPVAKNQDPQLYSGGSIIYIYIYL